MGCAAVVALLLIVGLCSAVRSERRIANGTAAPAEPTLRIGETYGIKDPGAVVCPTREGIEKVTDLANQDDARAFAQAMVLYTCRRLEPGTSVVVEDIDILGAFAQVRPVGDAISVHVAKSKVH